MTPKTEDKEEKDSSGLPFINDPGNEDPGSLMDDATVPLIELDDARDVGNMSNDPKIEDIDETPEYPLPSPTDSLGCNQLPPEDDAGVEQILKEGVKRADIKHSPKKPKIVGSN